MILNRNLEENLKRLNHKFKRYGLEFNPEGNIIKVIEHQKYLLNDNPKAKEFLRGRYFVEFNNIHLWHIGQYGITRLSNKIIKVKPSEGIDVFREKLYSFIEEIEEPELKISIKNTLEKYPIFFESPGAKIKHHAYKGGLLEHTVQTIEFSLAIISNLDNKDILLDKDLIIAGAILHDIGKINCYRTENGFFEITETFLKQEHIINGIKIISQEIESNKLDDLIHIIASHHNLKDWGSPIKPAMDEAWIVHFAENLSSKIG